jgi:reprolysin-like metallo-peptidase family M12B
MNRGGVLVAVVALLLMVPASPATSAPTRDDLCEPQWVKPIPEGTKVLPVIVHYMKSTGHKNQVWNVFKQATLIDYFKENGTINTIWKQAGVRLFLHRIEHCRYDPVAMTGQIKGSKREELPDPTKVGPEMYDRVVRFYNYREVAGLDLYLWWELGGTVTGFAVPYRLSDGSERTGSVWVDTQCVRTPDMLKRCPNLVAHEIGHFLGLCHVCRVESDPVTGCTSCAGPQDRIPLCSSPSAPLSIMRSRYDKTGLDGCQIKRAADHAQKRIESNSPR